MKITFENMRTARQSSGGNQLPGLATAQLRAPILMPSGSIPRRSPLKLSDIRQASMDILKLALAFLFVLVTGLAFVASFFMCFLCRF